MFVRARHDPAQGSHRYRPKKRKKGGGSRPLSAATTRAGARQSDPMCFVRFVLRFVRVRQLDSCRARRPAHETLAARAFWPSPVLTWITRGRIASAFGRVTVMMPCS